MDARFVAYLLNVQSFGHIRNPIADPDEILASGTSLVIVPRGSALAQRLGEDRRFGNADKQLFGCDEAKANPIEVFQTKPLMATDACADSRPGR